MAEKNKERLQEKAVNALLCSRTLEIAAARVGVSSKTISRWLKDPMFRTAYEEKKRDLFRAGVGNLLRRMYDAVETLAQVSQHKGRPYQGPRSHAASAIVKLALDAAVLEEIERRLTALEGQSRSREKFQIS